MVNTKRLAWLVGLAVAFGTAWYFFGSAATPDGQPPLKRLTNAGAFVSEFNQTAGDVRMVLLFSPT